MVCLAIACLPAQNSVEETITPTQCTGWICALDGKIILPEGVDVDIPIKEIEFEQISNCSPTRGVQVIPVMDDGSFTIDVYLHDTDSFVIAADAAGYEPVRNTFGGFECLYCSCVPIEIPLTAN